MIILPLPSNQKRYYISFNWSMGCYYIYDTVTHMVIEYAPPFKDHNDSINYVKFEELRSKMIELNNVNDELIAFTKEIINYTA